MGAWGALHSPGPSFHGHWLFMGGPDVNVTAITLNTSAALPVLPPLRVRPRDAPASSTAGGAAPPEPRPASSAGGPSGDQASLSSAALKPAGVNYAGEIGRASDLACRPDAQAGAFSLSRAVEKLCGLPASNRETE